MAVAAPALALTVTREPCPHYIVAPVGNGDLAMAYHFVLGDASVQDGVRRIALEQTGKAIDDIADKQCDVHDRIHEARKRCKKVRGLIRLVRPSFDDYRRENAAFRDAAKALSFVRDSEVLIETYDTLVEAYRHQIERAAFAPIRRQLTLRLKNLNRQQRALDRKLSHMGSLMREAQRRIRRWQLGDRGFDAFAGLAKTHKRAVKAMAAAQKDSSPEAFHEWRKRIKYHGYHAWLLTPVWDGPMKAYRKATEKLGDLLGDHHDLSVFQKRLASEPDVFGGQADVEVMIGLARRRQAVLAAEAFALGARLLAEPTPQLATRWQAYWDTWRSEQAPEKQALAA
jgi:CHAD domain-containing protein